MTEFNLQPSLSGQKVFLIPLKNEDFNKLYLVASDPLIWEQHPNPDRYKKEVFTNFFEGAMQSGGAFAIMDAITSEIIGSTRFYHFQPQDSSVFIGYTFISRSYWGKGYNQEIKKLMLEYAFQFVDKVYFHVGINNIRSQKAMEKIGGSKVRIVEVAYYGEAVRQNVEYVIDKLRV